MTTLWKLAPGHHGNTIKSQSQTVTCSCAVSVSLFLFVFYLFISFCFSFLLLKHHVTLFTFIHKLSSGLCWQTLPKHKCSGWILTPAAFPPWHTNLALLFSIWLSFPSFLLPPHPFHIPPLIQDQIKLFLPQQTNWSAVVLEISHSLCDSLEQKRSG